MADQPSLTVLGGPLGGQRFAFENDVDSALIGSDPSCTFRLELPGVSPIHARVRLEATGIVVYDTQSPRGLYVNDDKVVTQIPLRNGDILWLGTPGEAGVVMIQCRVPPTATASAAATAAPATPEPGTHETQAITTDDDGAMFVDAVVDETAAAAEPMVEPMADPVVEPMVEPMVEPNVEPMIESEPTVAISVSPEPEPVVDNDQTLFEPPAAAGVDAGADAFFDDNQTQAIPAPASAPWAPAPTYDDVPASFTVDPPSAILPKPGPMPFEDETDESAMPTMAVSAPPVAELEPEPEPEPAPPPPPPPAPRPAAAPPRPAPSARPAGAASMPRIDPSVRPRPAGGQSMPPRPAASVSPRRPAKGGGGMGMGAILGIAGAVLVVAGGAAAYFLVFNKPAPTPVAVVTPAPPTAAPPTAPPPTEAPAVATEVPTEAAVEPTPVEVVTLVNPTAPPAAATTPPRAAATATATATKSPTRAGATAAPTSAAPNPAALAAAAKAEAARSMAAGQYDAAITQFEEALRHAPGDPEATAGRAKATAARDAARRRFVAGTTSVKSSKAGKADLSGFESSDVKVAGAVDTSGRIDFEIRPERVKPGESYAVKVLLKNDGKKSFKIGGVTITSTANGSKSGGPVTPRAKEVEPGATVTLEELPGVWGEATTSWTMEVVVTTSRGESFRNTLSWK